MTDESIRRVFDKWCKKLRITPGWTVKLELTADNTCRKTGDFKVDCEDKKAIFLLNTAGPQSDNLEAVVVHELLHLKLYPLDQTTETLIESNFQPDTPAYEFAYSTFMQTLEQTVEELTKCFLLEFGENKEIPFGRCKNRKSFSELYDGLKNLE